MRVYLLDTNAVSDLMRENPKVDKRLKAAQEADIVCTCSIVRGEVLFGVEQLPQGRRRETLDATARKFLGLIACEAVPETAGDHYARTKRSCERKGLPLDENDLWIAATALALGAVLVTRDAHFERVEGLVTEDWTK